MGTCHTDNEGFYSQMKVLQDRLRKSEEERLKLEERFNLSSRSSQAEENARLKTFRESYTKLLKEDRMRCDRNETIMQTLERIESRASMLTAKTDRLRLLRKHYEAYISRLYPDWKKDNDVKSSNLKQFQPNHLYLGATNLYQSNPAHSSMYATSQSSPGSRNNSILFPDTGRRTSLATTPAIILTEPTRSPSESSVLRNLEESSKLTQKNLFSPTIFDTKLKNSEFSYHNEEFKPASSSPMLHLAQNKPSLYNDKQSSYLFGNNRIDSLDKDQNTSGDLLSMSLSDDGNIKDIPKDPKPDYYANLGRQQTNRWEHLAKAPSFGNKFSLDKKYTKSSELSFPVSPKLRNSLSRTTSFDTLSRYGQERNKYVHPSISRRQSLSSDNLDLRSDDLYKPKINSFDKTLNFGKYTSSVSSVISDDYDFKKYLVQPNTQFDRKYDDKFRSPSPIYLPGRNLLENKSSVDYNNPYNPKFDSDLPGSIKGFNKSSYLDKNKHYPDKTIHFENEDYGGSGDSLRYRSKDLRSPYSYQTDLGDYKYKFSNPETEKTTFYTPKTNFDKDRDFEEKEFKNNIFSKQNPFEEINEVNQVTENYKLKKLTRPNFNEENINVDGSELSQTKSRLSMLPDEMESLTEKLNQSVKSYLSSNGDNSNKNKNVMNDFSETNPNILSPTTSFQEKLSEYSTGTKGVDEVSKKELTQSNLKHSIKNKITEECDEDFTDHSNKQKVRFELQTESDNCKQNKKTDQMKNLEEHVKLSDNENILQHRDDIFDKTYASTYQENKDDTYSNHYLGTETSSLKLEPKENDQLINVSNISEKSKNIETLEISDDKPEIIDDNSKNSESYLPFKEQISKSNLAPNDTVMEENTEKNFSFIAKNIVPTSGNMELYNSDSTFKNNGTEKIKDQYSSIINDKELNKTEIEGNKPYEVVSGIEDNNTPMIKSLSKNVNETDQHQLEKNIQDQKGKELIADSDLNEQLYEHNIQNENQEYFSNDLKPNDQQDYYHGEIENTENQVVLEKSYQDQKEHEKQFTDDTEQQQFYEHNIQDSKEQEYYPNNLKSDQQEYYDENAMNQQYYEEDNQQIDQTTYDDNKLYYEDNNYHPGEVQRSSERVTHDTTDQHYYEGNQQYYTNQDNPDQQYYEGDPQYSVNQQYYEDDNQDQSKQYYEETDNSNNQQYDENIAHPAEQQLYAENIEDNSDQYYEQTQNKDALNQQPYQEGYDEKEHFYEGDLKNTVEQHDNITALKNEEQYYGNKLQDGQHTEGGQYYTDNDQTYESGEPRPNDQQYYEGDPEGRQYYEEHNNQAYPQGDYDNQQYYGQYAEGAATGYNQEQQYAEGNNYQYEYDQEGYENYPQVGNQYPDQYDPGQGYSYPEDGIEGSGNQEYKVEENNEGTVGVEDSGYLLSQEQRLTSAEYQEQQEPEYDQHGEIPFQHPEVPVNPASEENQKQPKKQISLSKVLDSDSDSIVAAAGQNVNSDSSDFNFSSEKK